MIAITAKQMIKEEMIGKYHELVKELVEKSCAEEGNVSYCSVQDREDKRIHMFLEIWKDQEAISIHNETEHFKRIIPQFAAMFAGPEEVILYDVVY